MGALTSKPYSFAARPWELYNVAHADYFDSHYSPIVVGKRGGAPLRVLPHVQSSRLNEWISDRARFSYDSFLSLSRLRHFKFRLRGKIYGVPRVSGCLFNSLLKRLLLFGRPVFDWLPSERVAYVSALDVRLGHYHVQADTPYGSDSYWSEPGRAGSIYIVGISLRYTHPIYFVALRRLQSQISVFEFGEANQLSTFSLGAGAGAFFHTFRFRSRAAALLADALVITSRRFYSKAYSILQNFKCFVLPESPTTISIMAHARVAGHFGSYHPRSLFDFLVPMSHPYETNTVVFRADDRVATLMNIDRGSDDVFSPFFTERLVAHPTWRNHFVAPAWSANQVASNLYSTYNHYDHFFGWEFLSNSNIITLTLKRNEDLRHSHFCFV